MYVLNEYYHFHRKKFQGHFKIYNENIINTLRLVDILMFEMIDSDHDH